MIVAKENNHPVTQDLSYKEIGIQSQTEKETDHKYHESTEKIITNRPKGRE
jgi:hypothetical protein